MKPLTSEEYIKTRGRSLPVYKCLVNNNWDKDHFGYVLVLRRHKNGNTTVGIFLIDLLCLGVKDTLYQFNLTEDQLEHIMDLQDDMTFMEIDYNLAHNIIYAGHDFAMDFDIQPHRDFKTTRFLLEEDDESIPLIEITVGAADGKPHLVVDVPGQYSDALAKLKLHAGEDGFYYTVDIDDKPGEEPYSLIEDDNPEYDQSLDSYETGTLECLNAQFIRTKDLRNLNNYKKRSLMEQEIMYAALFTRFLPDTMKKCPPKEEKKWEAIREASDRILQLPHGITMNEFREYEEYILKATQIAQVTYGAGQQNKEDYEKAMIALLEKSAENPLIVSIAYSNAVSIQLNQLAELADRYVTKMHSGYPLLQLDLALGSLLRGETDSRFQRIYREQAISDVFPGYEDFHFIELLTFWFIKIWQCLDAGNLKDALQYYQMAADFDWNTWYHVPVLEKLNKALSEWYRSGEWKGKFLMVPFGKYY